jgi:hypothetical protein
VSASVIGLVDAVASPQLLTRGTGMAACGVTVMVVPVEPDGEISSSDWDPGVLGGGTKLIGWSLTTVRWCS